MGILQEISLMKYDAVPIPSFFIKNKKSKEFCFYSLSVELKESKQGQLELERICDSQIVGYIDFLDILIRQHINCLSASCLDNQYFASQTIINFFRALLIAVFNTYRP